MQDDLLAATSGGYHFDHVIPTNNLRIDLTRSEDSPPSVPAPGRPTSSAANQPRAEHIGPIATCPRKPTLGAATCMSNRTSVAAASISSSSSSSSSSNSSSSSSSSRAVRHLRATYT